MSSINSAVIYPNPFTSNAIIKFDKNMNDATIKIYNVRGQVAKESHFSGTNYILSREELDAGMYFLQIVSREEISAPIKIIAN